MAFLFMTKTVSLSTAREYSCFTYIAEGNRYPVPLIFNQNMIFNILKCT